MESYGGTTETHRDIVKESISDLSSNITLLSLILMSLPNNKSSSKSTNIFKKEYDYVIVGGGSAGAVLANHLSEKPCVTVLLLEAGGEPPPITEVPAFSTLLLGTPIDWQYKTTPQRYGGFSQSDKRVTWNAGKVLGGTSVINAMEYIRGNKHNYDDWADQGATGWSYADVLPYFKKLEDNRNIKELDPGYHSTRGPLTAEKPDYSAEVKEPLMNAMNSMGYETVDANGKRQTGVFDFQATTRDHWRCSTAKAYLGDDIRNRPNLDILLRAFAKKILIDKKPSGENRAYGIEFDLLKVPHTVRARKEVIISTGTVRTPQILMLSGIGPKAQLKKFNIDMVVDLPVGGNLQDQVYGTLVYTVNESITALPEKLLNPDNIADYVNNRKGPLSSPAQAILIAFLEGLNTTFHSRDFPRQQIVFVESAVPKSTASSDNTKQDPSGESHLAKPAYACISSLLQPYSRGKITLRSTDPYDTPKINPNYFKDKRDVETIVGGMKVCHSVAERPEMREVQPQLVRNEFPVCEKYYNNDMTKYFTCCVLQKIQTAWHTVGTARMGSRSDPRSVVDTELRVIGVKNLRAISGAVLPIVPSGNTNVPIIMVAEKASDIIKKGIKCTKTPNRSRNCRKLKNTPKKA